MIDIKKLFPEITLYASICSYNLRLKVTPCLNVIIPLNLKSDSFWRKVNKCDNKFILSPNTNHTK